MKLEKLRLKNYRCFGSDTAEISFNDTTAYIGNNGAGKTAAMAALNTLFSSNTSDRVLKRTDFYLPQGENYDDHNSIELSIEAVFSFEPLASSTKPDIPCFYDHFIVDKQDGDPYIRIRLEATWENTGTIDGAIESRIYYITTPDTSSEPEKKLTAYRKDLDKIRVIYIPAVRNPSQQLRAASGQMLYQLLKSINIKDSEQSGIITKINELENSFLNIAGINDLNNSIGSQWDLFCHDDRFHNAHLVFNSEDLSSTLRSSKLAFNSKDSKSKWTVEDLSDGQRSIFFISLVCSLLDVESKIESTSDSSEFKYRPPLLTIIELEEPENHVAPHLMGELIKNIQQLANKGQSQVVLSSHSPAIIKRIDPESVRCFRSNYSEGSRIKSIEFEQNESVEDRYKYIKEAIQAYPEMYFAKAIIFCEGDSEEIILPKFWSLTERKIDESGLSIVPLGGRHVNHFWRLAHALEIPFVTLLDLDKERSTGGLDRIKYVIEQLEKYHKNNVHKDKFEAWKSTYLTNEISTSQEQELISALEEFNVFFSDPLDLDFMMLEKFGPIYKKTCRKNEGPTIKINSRKIKVSEIEEELDLYTLIGGELESETETAYRERIEDAVKQTLKSDGGNGNTYSDEQQKLMIWYSYFFLSRGKPSTHIMAMSSANKDELIMNMPEVFKRLFLKVDEQLEGKEK